MTPLGCDEDLLKFYFKWHNVIFVMIVVLSVIRIGLEFRTYTYMEPIFEETIDEHFNPKLNLPEHGPIYITKENDMSTEQTFLIYIHTSASVPTDSDQVIHPATSNVDYILSGTLTFVVLHFGPEQRKINVPLTLFSDDLSEGTEAFRISIAADNTAEIDGRTVRVPTYLNPISLPSESFVIIEGRYLCNIMLEHVRHYLCIHQ